MTSRGRAGRYTRGMKTAVSVPDDIFEKADHLARREGRSRSDVYAAALREYVARHSPDELSDSIDRSLTDLGDEAALDAFVAAAGARVLGSSEW